MGCAAAATASVGSSKCSRRSSRSGSSNRPVIFAWVAETAVAAGRAAG